MIYDLLRELAAQIKKKHTYIELQQEHTHTHTHV